MDRINKFLDARQVKNQKTLRYKNEKIIIKKEDLKLVRAYKSAKCLDPSIKNVPSRILSYSSEPAQSVVKVKKDLSDYFNKKLLEHYKRNPKEKIIESNKNEIRDIWEDENLDDLKNYTQEWIYSIAEQYKGQVENLQFTKDDLEEELKRVYMKHFRPKDLKIKPIRDILPKLPSLNYMKPYPEFESFEWKIEGRKFIFGSLICSIIGNRILTIDIKINRIMVDHIFEENIYKVYCSSNALIVCSKQTIYIKYLNSSDSFKEVISIDKIIKDIYIDNTFIGLLTSKSIHLFDCKTYQEVKILKFKGDTPHSIKINEDMIYSSTHKGIMVDSAEKSEIKNLGYVIDFELGPESIFVINNLGRVLIVDKNLKIVGNTVQGEIGCQIRYSPDYHLLAVLFSNEIGIYKIVENNCIPLNTINGSFKSIGWDEKMPWLYASHKNGVVMIT